MSRTDLAADLRAALPGVEVLTDEGSLASYGRDWTELWEPRPAAVALPRSVAEVQALVRFANERGAALVPSGGRTGLSGGAVAAAGEIVVASDRLDRILDFSPLDRTVQVQAGVVTRTVQEYAADRGLFFPVDFGSAASSRIGGNLATNAGGTRVVRYGTFREWVAGLVVVTGTGDLLDLNRGLVKNATGYDLRHLFIGSEGTLGIIVAATLRLTTPPGPRAALLLAVPAMAHLMELFAAFREAVVLNAFELISDSALTYVLAATGLGRPLAAPAAFYALVDCERGEGGGGLDAALAVAERAVAEGRVADAVVAEDEADVRRLWRLREAITESVAPRHPYKNDLSVVPSRVPAFLADVEAELARGYPGFEIVWYGHIGDGNLHLGILRPEGMAPEDFRRRCEEVNERLFAVVARHGGSISAEHGVGLLKRPYLHYSRSPEEIAYLRRLKAAFDPNGVMNPGKLLDPPVR
jgi:FAD/FMN-containing dehydrogenase